MTKRLRGIGAAVAAGALAVGLSACGGSSEPTAAEHGMTAEEHTQWQAEQQAQGGAAADAHGGDAAGGGHHGGAPGEIELWAVQSETFKVAVTDGNGRLVYRYDRDSSQPPASSCIDPVCTASWEPLLATGEVTGLGVDQDKIGTVFRPDGTQQITLAGWPLYTHAGENGGLANTGGNGTDGVWFAVAPTGDHAALSTS